MATGARACCVVCSALTPGPAVQIVLTGSSGPLSLHTHYLEHTMAEAEWMLRAVRRHPLEDVANLLDHHLALVHARGGVYRWTPLMSAAYEGRPEMLSLLLDRGAIVNAVDRDGHSALHEAAMHGRKDAVKVLLARGADATIKNGTGVTALMRAAMSGHLAIVRLLLAHAGARGTVDERDYKGETALWKACAQGHVEVARALLLEGRADHTKVDNKGRSAKQAARDMYFYYCEETMTRFEEELERPYVVHKLRGISDMSLTRLHSPRAPLPCYVSRRGGCGLGLPVVHIVEPNEEESTHTWRKAQQWEEGPESMQGVEPFEGQDDTGAMQVETAEEGGGLEDEEEDEEEDGEKRGGGEDQQEHREQLTAALTHVLHGLNDQLYIELMLMLRLR